jgi:hypothetical protein
VLFVLLLAASGPAAELEGELEGIFSVWFENDWFLNNDNRHTNGLGGDADHFMQFAFTGADQLQELTSGTCGTGAT